MLALTLGAAACGSERPGTEGWLGTREWIDSVEIVRNPVTPVLGDEEVAATMLWTAPQDSLSTESPVWEEAGVVRTAGESTYVLDRMAHVVHELRTSDGSYIRSLGGQGSGPGELERPYSISPLGGDLVIGNAGNASFEIFGPGGEYTGSVRTGALGFAAFPLPPGRLLANLLLGREGGWRVVHLDGTSATLAMPEAVLPTDGDFKRCERIATSGSNILRTSCAIPHIQVMDDQGVLLREILIPTEPEKTSAEALSKHTTQIRTTMAQSGLPAGLIQQVVDNAEERLRTNPKISGIRQDSASGLYALWEQNPRDLGDGPATVHLLSGTGVFLATLPFDRPWVDFDLADSTVFALVREPETDLVSLVAYRLDLPKQ